MPTQSKPYLTPEQYLEIERKAEFKSEYHDGEMFPMDGERRPGDPIVENREAHRLIISNISARINEQLRGRQCRNYVAGMRVYIPAASLHPDVTVVCGEPQFADDTRDTLLNPNLIVEVLSPSTEAYDRGRKFEYYRSIPSVTQYLLISSDHVNVELFTRDASGWRLTAASRMEDFIELPSAGCRLQLADLYEKVEFDPTSPR